MIFLLVAVLLILLYIAQLLRKLVWLLALVTQNQLIALRIANKQPANDVVVGFYGAIRFPWLFRKAELFNSSKT